MKKTCFLIPGIDAGGIENYLLRFINFLPEKDGITIIVRSEKKGDLWPEYEKTGVNFRFQGVGFINPLKWFKLFRYFRKQQFKTVCDFNGNFAGITMLLARMAGVKNRIAFYRRSSNAFKQTWFNLKYNDLVNWFVFNYATKILSNSQHAIDFFFPYRQIRDKRFRVIPNGIDPDMFEMKETKEEARKFFHLPTNRFIVGHVGRYDPAKNHETIFKVAQKLKQENQNINFLFAGKGTDNPDFLGKIKWYGIEDICHCLGLQTNLPLLYKSMDLFYFPSFTEGQPNALIEAMMAGLSVLASNIPPIKETMPERAHSILINPLDSDLAALSIMKLFKNQSVEGELIFKTEAEMKFNQKTNFTLFLKELSDE
ncbi:MAG: glycosyltransferase [Lentimicrobium sp.]|nr:glycosyltransferase [Lentimicrobium sp.]